MKKPFVVLMILDGFGMREDVHGNAIAAADTPNIDRLFMRWPLTTLGASGSDVGLPEGQMGNSEVGHINMGAGRIVYQDLSRISYAIRKGTFFENSGLIQAMDACRNGKTLHLMGLLSDGGVHSHIDHLYALMKMAKERGVERVKIHCFLDGRDVVPASAAKYVKELRGKIREIGIGEIATMSGRLYPMDRDKRWERVERAYDAIVKGRGSQFTDAQLAVQDNYQKGVTDEFMEPMVAKGYHGFERGDAVIFYNFRPDRAREITRAMVDPAFDGFERELPEFSAFVTMREYDAKIPNVIVAFETQKHKNTLQYYLERKGLNQLHIAETEKYAHVTFFFGCGVEQPCAHEDRILIASPKVTTYDEKPEMSAYEITDRLLRRLDEKHYDFVVLNYANCDMVGHTGVFDAAVKAVEAVDDCVGLVVDNVLQKGGVILLTADHGNADQMLTERGERMTAHSTSPVPFCTIGLDRPLREGGILADIAPTVLKIFDLPKPEEMTGSSIIL